ncbi:hypothetical protein BaRGS_00013436, partial [Batillaria attramentaria]
SPINPSLPPGDPRNVLVTRDPWGDMVIDRLGMVCGRGNPGGPADVAATPPFVFITANRLTYIARRATGKSATDTNGVDFLHKTQVPRHRSKGTYSRPDPESALSLLPRVMDVRGVATPLSEGKPAYEMMETDPDWVPSLHMGHTEMKTTNTGRFNRCQEREKARQEAEMVKATALQEEEALVHEAQLQADASATATVATQTDLTGTDMPQFDAGHLRLMQEEINRLAEENHRLKKELQDKELTEESFKEDDTK